MLLLAVFSHKWKGRKAWRVPISYLFSLASAIFCPQRLVNRSRGVRRRRKKQSCIACTQRHGSFFPFRRRWFLSGVAADGSFLGLEDVNDLLFIVGSFSYLGTVVLLLLLLLSQLISRCGHPDGVLAVGLACTGWDGIYGSDRINQAKRAFSIIYKTAGASRP